MKKKIHRGFSIIERFWMQVKKTKTCWLWISHTNKKGYGQIRVNGKIVKAHRFSYQQFIGPIPEGLHVLHKCDIPNCVNPKHLWIGTNFDNQQDSARKGRSSNCKLTPDDVREIRKRHPNEKGIDLAKEFNVSGSLIGMIASGKRWSHIT